MRSNSASAGWLGCGKGLAAALLALTTVACDPPPPPGEGVLRVLSWNTFLLPTIAGQMGQVNLDEEERGRLVAKRLKESPYDVIALNEVFDETVRDALIDEAQSGPRRFRFVVEDIDGGGREDSGLMLLSRLDAVRFKAPAPVGVQHQTRASAGQLPVAGTFAPFDGTVEEYLDTRNCADMDVWWAGHGGEVDAWVPGSTNNCLIAFHRYRHCTDVTPDGEPAGSECDAGKGVAYVRLMQRNGRELDVFWSHTQATLSSPEYETPLPDFLSARDGQLAELQAMVKQWSPSIERDAVVMGDLNVDGFADKDGKFGNEYRKQLGFEVESRFGNLGFRDLWPTSSTDEDRGASYSPGNDHLANDIAAERLDYLLWRDRKGYVSCNQHPKVERRYDVNNADGSSIDLSDHFGVGAELRQATLDENRQINEPCSPQRATLRKDLINEREMKGKLAVPGACHWLRVGKGTWTVTNLKAHPLRIEAYAASNVSEPLDFFRGDSTVNNKDKTGDEVQLATEDPFLLKICWAEADRTGEYRLDIAPNVGADAEHPIVLPLNRPVDVKFGNQFGTNPTTRIWTLVQLPNTFSSRGHALRVDLGAHGNVPLRLGTAPVGGANPSISWLNSLTTAEDPVDAGAHGGPATLELHAVIEREAPANPADGIGFSVRVTSDHYKVRLGVLECVEQEDSTGDDRIRMTYTADGRSEEIVDLGAFDEGQDVNLSGHNKLGQHWVRGDVRITIFDQDGEDLEDDVTSGNALDNLGSITIPAFIGAPPLAEEVVNDSGKFNQDEADYRLSYRRQR